MPLTPAQQALQNAYTGLPNNVGAIAPRSMDPMLQEVLMKQYKKLQETPEIDYNKYISSDYTDRQKQLLDSLLKQDQTPDTTYDDLATAIERNRNVIGMAPVRTDLSPAIAFLAPNLLGSYKRPESMENAQSKILEMIQSSAKIKELGQEKQAKRHGIMADIIKEAQKTEIDRRKAILDSMREDRKSMNEFVKTYSDAEYLASVGGRPVFAPRQPVGATPKKPKIETWMDLTKDQQKAATNAVVLNPSFVEKFGTKDTNALFDIAYKYQAEMEKEKLLGMVPIPNVIINRIVNNTSTPKKEKSKGLFGTAKEVKEEAGKIFNKYFGKQ